MDNYYFTFGQNHHTVDGVRLHNYWVRVIANNYGDSRDIFISMFAVPVMGDPLKWSMQYDEEHFKPEYFPGGEYMLIDQREMIDTNEEPDIQL